jgi:hypothetical protein
MAISESNGIPAAYNNGSIVLKVFQVDASGGGPMSCAVSTDGSLKSFEPMTINLNMAGNYGVLQQSNRVNSTVVATFASGTKCTGGSDKKTCVVRCRAGVDKNYGSCFAVKLASDTFHSKTVNHASINPGQENAKRDGNVEERAMDEDAVEIELETRALFERAGYTLSESHTNTIVQQVVKKMKSSHLVVKPSKAKRDLAQHFADELEQILAE